MGAADGVIMPIIITAHMANTKANSIGCHGAGAGIISPIPAGIMRKPVMSMPPIAMSPASHSTCAQASAVSATRVAAMTARSRRSTTSRAWPLMSFQCTMPLWLRWRWQNWP